MIAPKFRNELLNHVNRYRMTAADVVRLNYPATCSTRKAAERTLEQLVIEGDLGTAPLFGRRRYVFLTQQGLQNVAGDGEIGHSEEVRERSGPLSELAKIRAYGFLAFCCLSKHKRCRLMVHEFKAQFPDLYEVGASTSYYVDPEPAKPVLGFLRIDTGGSGHWDRVLKRFRVDLEEYYTHSGFRALVDCGGFEMTLVTALPQKAERLGVALSKHEDMPPVSVRVIAIPDLLYLIAPPPKAPQHSPLGF